MEPSRIEQYARIAAVTLLVLGCLLILRPFFGAIVFAAILSFSTWPAFAWLRDRWRGRGALAALAMVVAMLFVLALPVALAAQSLFVHSADVVEWVRNVVSSRNELAVPAFVR
jgi:predicted PurR-regulated permease PerM